MGMRWVRSRGFSRGSHTCSTQAARDGGPRRLLKKPDLSGLSLAGCLGVTMQAGPKRCRRGQRGLQARQHQAGRAGGSRAKRQSSARPAAHRHRQAGIALNGAQHDGGGPTPLRVHLHIQRHGAAASQLHSTMVGQMSGRGNRKPWLGPRTAAGQVQLAGASSVQACRP